MNISAIILAGGRSSRMKYNKEYIKIGDEYLVHKQIRDLLDFFEEVIVVSDNIDHYMDLDVLVVSDILVGNTPIIGLHAGLVISSNEYNYCIACDMPYINFKFIDHLINQVKDHDAYVAMNKSFIEPFHALYSKNIIGKIEKFIDQSNYGFQRLIKSLDTYIVQEKDVSFFQQGYDMFTNINKEADLYEHDTDIVSNYKYFDITKIVNGEEFSIKDKIITEYPLSLYVNNEKYAVMVMTPQDIELLIIGYLYSDLTIMNTDEIIDFKIDIEDNRCDVTLSHPLEMKNTQRLTILSSACGTSKSLEIDESTLPKVDFTHEFKSSELLDQVAIFNKESILFKETGGAHSVELVFGEEKILFEDIGRHNAVDKIVGYLLKNKINRDDIYLISSGRISSDILIKLALKNIGLIVSRSAPTSLAIKLADKLGITIIGFARGNKLNIYTHKKRIINQ